MQHPHYLTKLFFILFMVFLFFIPSTVSACKDIVATGDATAGDYNLLLKVRDPSRQDYQILTMIPEGYQYTYHHPWTGKKMNFVVEHNMIGVTSLGDSIPNIVKPGMCFTDAGLAFGDADTVSNWKNPSKYAWDDFDWIRFSAQTANDEEEAIQLLTEEAVDNLHAPAVPENLFVVGPEKGYVVEADVIHHVTSEVDGYVAMSNYPKDLWRKSLFYRAIAPSFDAEFEGTVRRGRTIRLGFGSIFGIRIVNIGTDYIEVKQVPIQYGKGNIVGRSITLLDTTRIGLQETKKVGFYSVTLNSIDGRKAMISMCFEYKEWEKILHQIIQSEYGSIDVADLMNWSRLHGNELNGLRSMCGENDAYRYEGDMIFKIPQIDYDLISEGWFSANHACSSIYVPVHICDTEIYKPYETGDAAKVSLELLDTYGHGYLSNFFHETEQVFINELQSLEPIIQNMIDTNQNISDFLTCSDMGMQKQAYLTQLAWLNASILQNDDEIIKKLCSIWERNYSTTLQNIKSIILKNEEQYNSDSFTKSVVDIARCIVETRIDLCKNMQYPIDDAIKDFEESELFFQKESYSQGIKTLFKSYQTCNQFLRGEQEKIINQEMNESNSENSVIIFLFYFSIFFAVLLLIFIGARQKRCMKKN